MAETNTISIVHAGGELNIERIDEELKALILSPEGTIPGNRNFGLAGEFLSRPPNEAVNILAMELEEKVEAFIPEITIANVEGNFGSNIEGMRMTIYVEGTDDS